MIGRRGFLQAIGAAVLGLSLAIRSPQPPMAVDFAFTPDPITEDLLDRYVRPAAQALADQIDQDASQYIYANSGLKMAPSHQLATNKLPVGNRG